MPWDFPTKATWRVTSVRCSALRPDSSGGRSVRIGRGFTAGWCAGSLQSADCHRHASPDLSAGSIGPGGLRGRMSCGRSRCALQETRHQNVVLGDSGPKSRFGRRFPHTETSPYVRNAAISRHFERDPIPYALERGGRIRTSASPNRNSPSALRSRADSRQLSQDWSHPRGWLPIRLWRPTARAACPSCSRSRAALGDGWRHRALHPH